MDPNSSTPPVTPDQPIPDVRPKSHTLIFVLLGTIILALGGGLAYLLMPLPANRLVPPSRLGANPNTQTKTPSIQPTTPVTNIPTQSPDSPNTLSTPNKIMTSDGIHYMMYGEPAGQNNKKLKKIIFSLPGHGSTAEQDYAAWKTQLLVNGTYALASINWWDGQGEAPKNYFTPEQVDREIKLFLAALNYSTSDFVILEGFSRGSANTYAVVANDVASQQRVIDGVISASGKYQSDFAMSAALLHQNNDRPFAGIPWILVCGEKDPNPTRDGCQGMKETQTFLNVTGANVLALLTDPNGGHGAFHMSSLQLAVQAMSLFDAVIK